MTLRQRARRAAQHGLLAFACFPGVAAALDLGFEALLSVDGSDNIDAISEGDSEREITDGTVGFAQFGVYGEQQGRIVRGAFSGEIENRRQFGDDEDVSTLTRFLGAADVAITPRSFSWYVGDILGGVRQDNAVQPINDTETRRRNVFVTGPAFVYDIDAFTSTRARLLYVNQSEDDVELESLYNASISWEREYAPGSLWGLRVGDIFVDKPSDSNEVDFNRSTGSVFWGRERRRLNLYVELGGTRYDADEETLNGFNAQVDATWRLSPQQKVTTSFGRDLQDQTLSTVESLIGDGAARQPEADGFFDETRLELNYTFQTSIATLEVGTGVTDSDYRLLAGEVGSANDQDQFASEVYGYLSRGLTPRLRVQFGLSYERLSYDNRPDETDSVLASTDLVYRLSRSFQFEAGYRFNRADGLRTNPGNDTATDFDIDLTENRVNVGLRWAPPSRANKDLTIELKSLLQ